MVLDPRTKKYLPKFLANAREVWTLWNDIKESCLELARGTRIPANQQLISMEGMQRAENRPSEQRRNRTGAASFSQNLLMRIWKMKLFSENFHVMI
jgi:hypothetical protein